MPSLDIRIAYCADDREALMFFPEGQVRVFLNGHPVSMRLSFDGLYALASHVMLQDPLSDNFVRVLQSARHADKGPVFRPDRSMRLGQPSVFILHLL